MLKIKPLLIVSVAILCLPLPCAWGQTAADGAPRPAFEVATIKPSNPSLSRHMIGVMNTPDGIDAQMATLSMLLRQAYGAQELPLASQIIGLPGWAMSQQYDIQAKLSEPDIEAFKKLSPPERQHRTSLMLQALLVARFNLQLHHGSQRVAAYNLVLGKGGFKLKPVSADDPNLIKGEDGRPLQGVARFHRKGEIDFQQETMPQFATLLTQQPGGPGRAVIDKTGLPDAYTFTLHWSSVAFVNQPAPSDSEQPSLFTALQEDLGLKLQPSTAELPTLIIDRLEKPTAN